MAYTVLDSKNIDKKKNIYTFGGSGTKPERADIAENSKLLDYSSGEKFYYDPTKAAGSKWQPDKEPSGGGSLPANFPEEGAANANKFVGFDANGDYTAKEGGSGGGQFVVTFSDVDFEHGTIGSADKTYAQVLAAVAAGQNVVASLSGTGFLIPVAQATNGFPIKFSNATYADTELLATVTLASDESTGFSISPLTSVSLLVNELTTLQNNLAPLIVNLTLDGTGDTPVLRGSATYGAIKDAQFAGKHVILKGSLEDKGDFAASVIDAVYDAEANVVALTFVRAGKLVFTDGLASNYVTIAAE